MQNATFNATKIAQHVTREDDEFYFLHIALDEECAGVRVTGLGMHIALNEDEGDGDLAVMWDVEGLENTGGGDMGMLLMRGNDDEVGAVMGEFYWNNAFTARLKEVLLATGFSDAAVDDVCTSEWGMQDEGRASYDAIAIADEVRKAME